MKVLIQRFLLYIDKMHVVLLMKVPWILSGNNTNAIGLLHGQNELILVTFQFAIMMDQIDIRSNAKEFSI